MKNSPYFRGPRLWVQGLLLLALRWAQLKTGFDPETGLARHSVPGAALAVLLVLMIAAEAALCFRLSGKKASYAACFRPMDKQDRFRLGTGLPLLGAGSVLLVLPATGGAPGTLSIATAAAGLAAMAGILLFARQTRSGGERVLPLLPAMVFSVLFLLSVYLPRDSDPVLARYYLPVLAASLTACAFYQLAGFACREASLRWFTFFGDLAVPASLAAMADSGDNWGRMIVFAGCAWILTAFLLLRREEPLPEEAEVPADREDPGEAEQS